MILISKKKETIDSFVVSFGKADEDIKKRVVDYYGDWMQLSEDQLYMYSKKVIDDILNDKFDIEPTN